MPADTENALAKFAITKEREDYRINIESDSGDTMQVSATQEQLELLADTLDELLDADDAGTAEDAEGEDTEEDSPEE